MIEVNGRQLYHNKNGYVTFTYINDFEAYVIEYANSYDEAKNNVFEDGDIYPIAFGETELIEKIKNDLLNYYC